MQNQLQKALREGKYTVETLQSELKLAVKPHPKYPNLLHFSYDMIESPMTNPVVKDARGTILDSANDWAIVNWGFSKFMNHGEPGADELDWESVTFYEKVDGTLIMVYWYDNQWHCATTGTPDAGGEVNGHGLTFAELFWEVAGKKGLKLPPEGGLLGTTIMFELVGPFNQVVVRYDHDVRWIGFRHSMGQELDPFLIGCPSFLPDDNKDWRPKRYLYTSMDEAKAHFKTVSGSEFEGFVAVDKYFNRAKIKHEIYVLLHHARDGFSKRRYVERIMSGEGLDQDVLTNFPDVKTEYEKLQTKYDALCQRLADGYETLKDIPVQKDFALKLLASDLPLKKVLFEVRKGVSIKEAISKLQSWHVEEALDKIP